MPFSTIFQLYRGPNEESRPLLLVSESSSPDAESESSPINILPEPKKLNVKKVNTKFNTI
jgi:hypothetical protein